MGQVIAKAVRGLWKGTKVAGKASWRATKYAGKKSWKATKYIGKKSGKIIDRAGHLVDIVDGVTRLWEYFSPDDKTDSKTFMLFARDLKIAGAENSRYWSWIPLEDDSNVLMNAAELVASSRLQVTAKFDTGVLSPGIRYEVAFVVMMKDNAEGWDHPVTLRLLSPKGLKQEHDEDFSKITRNEWIEIPVGEFTTSSENEGEMEINLQGSEDRFSKQGIVIKGVVIHPKN